MLMNFRIRIRKSKRNLIWIRIWIRKHFFGFVTVLISNMYCINYDYHKNFGLLKYMSGNRKLYSNILKGYSRKIISAQTEPHGMLVFTSCNLYNALIRRIRLNSQILVINMNITNTLCYGQNMVIFRNITLIK